jgi:hypothetical protein
MARHRLCAGCREGDHSRHDPRGNAPVGMLGGEACMCPGGCEPLPPDPELKAIVQSIRAASDPVPTWREAPVSAQEGVALGPER